MINRICFIVSMMSATAAFGQQNLFYNHYYINPSLYNPSYIAPSGYTELYLNYRKQWSGISGAPTTGTLNLHIPLNYKAGFAFSALQDEAGLLQTTKGFLSFSYQIYLGQKISDVHKLSFGLSAGISNSRLKGEEADDIQDPVLGNNNTSSMDGQFGFHYQYNNLKIGFALPTIFETRVVSEETFNQSGIAQLNSTISSISYDFHLGERVSLEPMVTYRTFEELEPQVEALASIKLSNVGWIGGAYRQDYGAFAFFGFTIKEKYKIGYAYEFATEQTDKIGNGSHEFQLILRLGKKHHGRPHAVVKQHEPAAAVAHAQTPTPHQPQPEKAPESNIIDPVETKEREIRDQQILPPAQPVAEQPTQPEQPRVVETIVEKPVQQNPADENPKVTPKVEVKSLDGQNLRPGHYVIVGAFANETNAKNYQKTLVRSGYPAHVSFHPARGYYVVHMDTVESIDEARALRDRYRQMSRYSFRDTWILSIE